MVTTDHSHNNNKKKRVCLLQIGIIIFCTITILSCSVFEYHPYETNIDSENTGLNSKAIEHILSNAQDKDTLTIIAMGDTQRFYNEVDDFVKSASEQMADFVLLNGDITDFGLQDEFEWVHGIMKRLNKPYLAVIGNHDLSGNGEEVYLKMYGSLNNSFIINRFKFILLNTNSREYNFNGRVPDIAWLKGQLKGNDFDHAVVISHIPAYDNDFDKNLEHAYATTLKESGKVNLSLHGHRHSFQEGEPYADGIRYLVSTSMDERMYLIIKLFGSQLTFEKIYY